MAWSKIGTGTPASAAGTSVAPAWPTHAADDIGLLFAKYRDPDSGTILTPDGWTLLAADASSSFEIRVFGKIAASGAEAAPTVAVSNTPDSNDTIQAFIDTWRGGLLDLANIVSAAAVFTSAISDATKEYGDYTPGHANALAVIAYGHDDNGTVGDTPAGFTEGNFVSSELGADAMLGYKYQIQTTATEVAAGAITVGSPAAAGGTLIFALREASAAGVVITNVGDELFYDGESMTISGTGFSATGNTVTISPTDDIDDVNAVEQTINTEDTTSINIAAADLTTFSYFADLYVFVTDDAAASNAAGYVIQREARFRITEDLYDRTAAANWASESNIFYRITDASINGTVLLSGSTETTDGSAILQTGYYTLTAGGDLSPDDHVYITLFQDDATLANTRGACVKYLPTYE